MTHPIQANSFLWSSSDFTGILNDTIDILDGVSIAPEGIAGISEGYQFRSGGQIIRGGLYVSILLPEDNENIDIARLYRFDNVSNRWLLDTISQRITTTEGTRVISEVKDLNYPFIVFSDTLAPKLTANVRLRTITSDESFSEEILLADNIDNCTIRLFAAAGGETFMETGTIEASPSDISGGQKYLITVPASAGVFR